MTEPQKAEEGAISSWTVNSIAVVHFTDEDLGFGQALTDLEQWQRTESDWRRLLRIEPHGIFKALYGGAKAGIAGVTAYDRVAWIHSVIVLREFRRRGVGKALMEACMSYISDLKIPTVKLDAVPDARQLYDRLGFVTEFESMRCVRTGDRLPSLARRIQQPDLDDVFELDRTVTGLDREKVLAAIFKDNPGFGFIVGPKGDTRGYLLARESPARTSLGPCVCKPGDTECARMLMRSALSQHPERKYRVCMSASNKSAISIAQDLVFERMTPSIRMYVGKPFQESDGKFAMISPEKG